ncbi:arsenic resistance protein [Corynebacterium sp. NPDC060344]|uniref:arsenic resistance protein n=1 Tax=Corynebacterium sp. NPDC060344 TaxID=3347101 RepID=UPI003667A8CC
MAGTGSRGAGDVAAGARSIPDWWDDHQVALYFAAIGVGALVGLVAERLGWTGLPAALAWWITPTLGLLLFATFLSVPVTRLGRAFRDVRFGAAIVGVNFFVAPWAVFGLSRFVVDDRGLLIGLLLVLLAPCIDYVIPFTGLAGGARARLLAATPMLLLLQMAALPLYLLMFVGPGQLFAGEALEGFLDPGPFIAAFAFLIIVPLAAAVVVQVAGGRADVLDDVPPSPSGAARRLARGVDRVMAAAMVPLMMATLALVIASQIADVTARFGDLARLVPLYAAYVPIALLLGVLTAKLARLDVPATRAVGFSAVTRNSLVVLPLALSLPAGLEIAALAVVTQTMVELVAMVIMVKLVPRIVREPRPPLPSR